MAATLANEKINEEQEDSESSHSEDLSHSNISDEESLPIIK